MNKKQLKKALLKKALGYDTEEVIEEYAEGEEGGEVKLLKRKVTKKTIPPDMVALKILLEEEGTEKPIADYTEEELLAERERLIGILEKENKE